MSKRVDIKTGFLCNNNCLFCVQGYNKSKGNRSTEDILKDLEEAKKTGCEGVVFTGGEVSIRDDLFELLSYAKKLRFSLIQVQTNGRRFYYKDFCKKAIDAGMNEFAPALHGHVPELHDYLTSCNGAFKQVTQAIKNVKEYGIYVITNTVVVKPNYRHLPEIAKLLINLKVDQYQFAFVHATGNAQDNFESIVPKVSLAAPYIHKGLQIGIDAGKKVMAEAMPYCVMHGYEDYVSELYIPETEIRGLKKYEPDFESVRKTQGKTKFPQCKDCEYDSICEGPWKEYPEKFGSKEFQPVRKTLDLKMNAHKDLFLRNLSGNILDVGCGFLYPYEYYIKGVLKNKITEIHCFDPNPVTKLLMKCIPKKIKNNFDIEVNSLEKISLTKDYYDNIILRYVFNHLKDKQESLKKLFDSLKKGGKIYFLEGFNDEIIEENSLNFLNNNIKNNIKDRILIYKEHLNKNEFRKFQSEIFNYYVNEPESDKQSYFKKIKSLFHEVKIKIIHELEGNAYGEKTLQIIAQKK